MQAFHLTDYCAAVRIILFYAVQYCCGFQITTLLTHCINVVIQANITHRSVICDAQTVNQLLDDVDRTHRITHIDCVNFAFLEVGYLCYIFAHILFFCEYRRSLCINPAEAIVLRDIYAFCFSKLHIFPCCRMNMTEKMVLRFSFQNEVEDIY